MKQIRPFLSVLAIVLLTIFLRSQVAYEQTPGNTADSSQAASLSAQHIVSDFFQPGFSVKLQSSTQKEPPAKPVLIMTSALVAVIDTGFERIIRFCTTHYLYTGIFLLLFPFHSFL